MSEIELMLLK